MYKIVNRRMNLTVPTIFCILLLFSLIPVVNAEGDQETALGKAEAVLAEIDATGIIDKVKLDEAFRMLVDDGLVSEPSSYFAQSDREPLLDRFEEVYGPNLKDYPSTEGRVWLLHMLTGYRQTQLIPREVLWGNPDKSSVRLSLDGTRISYIAPVDGVMNVWVGPADDPSAAKPVTNDTFSGIYYYGWVYTNEHILYLQDQAGNENWRVYSVNLETGETIDLTPLEGVQARVQAVSPEFPNEILVALNDRIPQLHDLYRINIDTGERTLVLQNNGFVSFIIDDEYTVRLAGRITFDGGGEYLKPTEEGGWEPFIQIPMEDILTTSPVWLDKTGNILYMIDSRDRDTSALFSLNLETGEYTLIAEDPLADLSDLMINPIDWSPQAVAFTYERKHWQILNESIAEDLAYLRTVTDGDVEIISRTLDDKYWIVVYFLDNSPLQYYLYDRETQEAKFLFTNNVALEGSSLAKMNPIIIESRDRLNLISYYTLPVGSDSDGDGYPDDPMPMVLLVHGGPWSRDSWGYNPVHQWLANRGYAVLSVNFRGSTGFGKAFINAGNMEWGGKMHDDLIDAVQWAIDKDIADPARVAIMGGSYGGYATLWGMTNTSETFSCGVAWAAPSNLITLLEAIPPYWEPTVELFATRVGDHRTEEGRAFLNERSPLTYVDQIRRPLLIGQGANDVRAKQAEADQIVQAMQEKNIPVTYILYPDEGHGIARPENAKSLFAVAELFFYKCLNGRYEPIGDDFEGSSITVPVGAEELPDLKRALTSLIWQRTGGFIGLNEQLFIQPDGSIYYLSDKFGEGELKLTEDEFEGLLALLDEVGFFTFEDKYAAKPNVADFFSYRLTVQTASDEKTIEWVDSWASYKAIPRGLADVQLYIETIIERIHQNIGGLEDADKRAIETAKNFIVQAQTFQYDGIPDTLAVIDIKILESFPAQYLITFTFESRHAGYGDREDQVLAQVITLHTAIVKIVNDNVISAILDDQWDELNQKFIDK